MKDAIVRLIRKIIPESIVRVAENIYRSTRAFVVNLGYGFPAKGLKIIGITGTNGKTTTCNYVNEILKANGLKTAMFTTAVIEMNGKCSPNELNRTVPLTAQLFAFFKEAKMQNVDWVVMEVTAHAIDQHKFDFVPFEVVAVTNLTQDHLDYFETMNKYASVKSRLLEKKNKAVVLNIDDQWFDFFYGKSSGKQVLTFGENKNAMVRLEKLNPSIASTKFTVVDTSASRHEISTSLIGEFNAFNAINAYAVGLALQIPEKTIVNGLQNLHSVPGRMEKIEEGQNFVVIVDYAHTTDAIEKVLGSLKSLGAKKIRLVFGATGDRDKAKRPDMGIVAGKYADEIYLTDDEPYYESPESIRSEVMGGIKKVNAEKKTREIGSRREAISAAINDAEKNDVVVITGMGHEKFRMVSGKKEPWDERQIVRQAVKKRLGK